ncbi:extracellular solute-binding protein [Thermoflavimicrobium dichotomicum]|uniref:Iron(III) transport system substrate-binding protein n=1 Tax=Thermoflavimicrobium dichotomicum TaxID=46223 RepID=A0A1I3TFJ0_9BACL|nr:extracellular solute-binding protein [Thermoflavimicrobium dichotomicum]SFJ69390.1 iron(III) transport system substrate-binding protein [Thermoflavimicrobium dichotomicum]
MKKWVKWLSLGLVAALMIPLAACGGSTSKSDEKKKLVIYTGRDKNVVNTVISKFKQKYPDIEVEALTMGAQEILERVRGEKANPQADFWWGAPQTTLMTAAEEGLLESYKPGFADKIPANYKDAQHRWVGEMLLPEVIMYNSKALKKEEAPQDWDQLLDPKFKDKIVIRGVMQSGTMRMIYSSMIYRLGADQPQKGYEWLKKLDANTKEYTPNPTSLYLKLTRQEGTVSVWNLQDIMIQKELKKMPVDFIYPKSGAPILVDGVGIVKGAKNADAAKKFYEFLFEEQTASELSKKFYQIPTRTDLKKPDWLAGTELKPLNIDWAVMAKKEKEWMQYWDANIKNKGKK